MPTPSGLPTKTDFQNAQLDVAHLGRVVNSKDAQGNQITTSTNRTGGVNKTLYALEAEYTEAIRNAGGQPIGDGTWQAGQTFTAYNQFLVYNGIAYKPLTTTVLPYGPTGATPDLAFVGPFDANDHSTLTNRGNPDAHPAGAIAGVTITFDSIAGLKSQIDYAGNAVDLSSMIGRRVQWLGYYKTSDGGSNWGIVRSGAHTEDGGSVFSIDSNTYIAANLTIGCRVSAVKFGAVGDGDASLAKREANSLAILNLVNYLKSSGNVNLYIPRGSEGSRIWCFKNTIDLAPKLKLSGDGLKETILNFPSGVTAVKIYSDGGLEDIGLEMVVDNASFATGIEVVGSDSNRPFNVFISRVFVGNYYTALETYYMWASVVKSLYTTNTARGLFAKGISVNNTLKSCQLAGRNIKDDNAAIQIGDGLIATEGWFITGNLTFGFGIGLHLNRCSHCASSGNIFDFNYRFGILLSNVSINNKFTNEYIGMSNLATCGFYANNSTDNPQSKGNKFSQSDVVAYGSLANGIILSQYEHNARIDKISVDACDISSITVQGSPRNVRVTGCNFESDNATFGNNGQSRASLVYWNGNTGGLASSYIAIKFDDGLSVARYVSAQPSSGDYLVGDTAINRSSVVPGVYKWVCTVAGNAGSTAQFKAVLMN